MVPALLELRENIQNRKCFWSGQGDSAAMELGSPFEEFAKIIVSVHGRYVSHDEIANEVSPHRSDPLVASRRAKLEARKALKGWFEREGRMNKFPEDVIETKSGEGSRIMVSCFAENHR